MKAAAKNWIWFVVIMALILGAGVYLGKNRRDELGKGFEYSLDDYRQVDPALIRYKELMQLDMGLGTQKLGAMAIDDDGTLYVTGDNSISILNSLLGKPKELKISGRPTCVAVDDEGAIFLGFQDHIEVYSTEGDLLDSWKIPSEKALLTSIDVDDSHVYVADAGSRKVRRYGKSGGDLFVIGEKDEEKGIRGFYIPSPFFDLALSRADGSLWTVNPGHHAFENYRPDGELLSSWEASSMRIEGFCGCCNPSHFALMADGSFVTAEKGIPRVKIHNVDGSLRCVVAAPDQFEEGVTGLDVAVDGEGRIYVLDPSLNKVRVFEEIK